MITLTCDGCTHRFDAPDSAAGTTVRCPKCAAPNGVPGFPSNDHAGVAPESRDVSTDHASERQLLFVRPAMFRARPARFGGLLLIVLAGLGGAGYFLSTSEPALALVSGLCSLLGIVPLLLWKLTCFFASLEITSRRTILNRGLFSKTTSEVRHEDIKNFQVDQTFQQRLFNVGTVGISSSGQEGIEILVKDVPKPYRVREIIDRHRRR